MATMARGGKVVRTRDNFGDYAESWIASLSRRPRTLDAYRYALDRHLLPRFKNRRVADITPDDVARMVSEMRRAGYCEWTISGAVSTLSGCLGKATRRGLIASNPCKALAADERPKQRSGEKRVLSEKEIRAVLSGATDRFRPLIAVMLFAGLRLGELLALRWDDVDFDDGFLRVRFQLSPQRELVELKTDNGRRDVVLIPQLGKALREHRMASRRKAPTDFVFCTAPDGRGRDQRSTARGVERAIEAAKLDGQGISSHSFRHTLREPLDRRPEARPGCRRGPTWARQPRDDAGHLRAHVRPGAARRRDARAALGWLRAPARGQGRVELTFRVDIGAFRTRERHPRRNEKPRLPGLFSKRMMGLEPTTFCMASRRSSQLSYIRVGAPV